jgi:hypothetical protein
LVNLFTKFLNKTLNDFTFIFIQTFKESNIAIETTTHAIWSCPYAGSVWALALGAFQKMPLVDIDFFLLSSKIFRDTSREQIKIWTVTSWAIWYSQNQFVHGHPLLSPQDTMDLESRLLNDYHRVTAVQSMAPPGAP